MRAGERSLQLLYRGETEQQAFDARSVSERDCHLEVVAAGLALHDDALAKDLVRYLVAGCQMGGWRCCLTACAASGTLAGDVGGAGGPYRSRSAERPLAIVASGRGGKPGASYALS